MQLRMDGGGAAGDVLGVDEQALAALTGLALQIEQADVLLDAGIGAVAVQRLADIGMAVGVKPVGLVAHVHPAAAR